MLSLTISPRAAQLSLIALLYNAQHFRVRASALREATKLLERLSLSASSDPSPFLLYRSKDVEEEAERTLHETEASLIAESAAVLFRRAMRSMIDDRA